MTDRYTSDLNMTRLSFSENKHSSI